MTRLAGGDLGSPLGLGQQTMEAGTDPVVGVGWPCLARGSCLRSWNEQIRGSEVVFAAGAGRVIESKLVSENPAAWKAENELGAMNSRCYSWGAVVVCTGAVQA